MADPSPYIVEYSFSSWQANNPSKPLPAPQVDNELANIATAVDDLVECVKDVRRSDGSLQNSVVTYDSLDSGLQAQIGVGIEAALIAAEAAQTAAETAEDNAVAAAAAAALSAANLTGTSTSSVLLGLGSKSFTTQSGKSFTPGTPVTITSDANPTGRLLTGLVSGYSGTALTVDVTAFTGTGTFIDWTIRVTGTPGQKGDAGSPGAGTGDMVAANNLSELTSVATARGNLALGSLATKSTITASELSSSSVGTSAIVNSAVTFSRIDPNALSSQANAEAGTSSSFLMTPLRTFQAIAKQRVGTSLYQTTGTPIPGSTWTTVLFDTEAWDDGAWHSLVSNTERITFDFTGRVMVEASYDSNTIANISIGIRIRKNGTVVARYFSAMGQVPDENAQVSLTTEISVVSTDYVDMQVYQTNGTSPITTGVGLAGTKLSAKQVK